MTESVVGSVAQHRKAEQAMFEMDAAKSRGHWWTAAACADAAALWEERALATLRECCSERTRTIAVVEESAQSLRALAREYRAKADA